MCSIFSPPNSVSSAVSTSSTLVCTLAHLFLIQTYCIAMKKKFSDCWIQMCCYLFWRQRISLNIFEGHCCFECTYEIPYCTDAYKITKIPYRTDSGNEVYSVGTSVREPYLAVGDSVKHLTDLSRLIDLLLTPGQWVRRGQGVHSKHFVHIIQDDVVFLQKSREVN